MVRTFQRVRAAGAIAIVVVSLVAWMVARTMARTRESTDWIVHIQEVLTTTELVLGSLVDAEAGARGDLVSASPRDLDALDRADRNLSSAVDRLGILTADNPRQQVRVQTLRGQTAQALRDMRGLASARPDGAAAGPATIDSQRASMDTARGTLQAIRLEENALLASRVEADRLAMTRLRWMLAAVGLAAAGLIGWVMWRLAREASQHRHGADLLRGAAADLEAQIAARTVELRDANARLRTIIDSAVDGIIVIDAAGRIEAFNHGAERLFGYPEAEVLGRNVSMLMPSPDHEQHDGYLARYVTTGEARIIGSGRRVTGRRRDGATFPLHLSVGEMTIAGQRKFTGMLHDLSERVRLEDELRGSEARWRAVIDSAVDGIIVIDAHGRIEAFNPAAERLFGYAASEVAGLNVKTLMPSPYHEEHDTYLTRYLATGTRQIIGTGREVTGLRKDGSTFPLHLSVGEMNVHGERKFTGIVHDLESRVRMEGQLREQSTLARLGEMAAVIAHEVRNPMAGIRAAMQVIGGRLPAGSRDVEMIAQIVARIDALNNLMKDLLMFARPPTPRAAPVDPRALVTATADLLGGDPAFKTVRVVVTGDTPPILADPELLQIVFVNLLVNGAQAMSNGGTIEVSVTATAETCWIAFTDQGPGIPPEIRERLFTPFVTTKSRGTGLGLSTAKRLIEAHRGAITVSSPDAGGTTVTVHLPAGSPFPPPAGR